MESHMDNSIIRGISLSIRDFCQNGSLHGYKYLVEPNRSVGEKIIWTVLHVISLTAAIYLVLFAWNEFTDRPTFTSLQSQKYPIWEVPFPAVAICSMNRISKRAANQYADELIMKGINDTKTTVLRGIRYLGRLIDYDLDGAEEFLYFQEKLDIVDVNEMGNFDVVKRMQMLAPNCSDLLVKCQWGGIYANCSEIFMVRRTIDGHCCTFNYKRVYDDQPYEFRENETLRTSEIGTTSGLTVVLNTSSDDYFYTLKNIIGFNIDIFQPFDYPDWATGQLSQHVVGQHVETLLKLDVRTIVADTAIEQYTIEQRNCMFNFEKQREFDGYYSQSECLNTCRMRSVLALCDCLPYFMSMKHSKEEQAVDRCTLNNLGCLNRFKVTMNTFRPLHTNREGLEKDFEDSIDCSECVPLCSETQLNVQSTYSPIWSKNPNSLKWGILEDVDDVENISILRVFYPFVASMLYKTDVVYTWYEIISYFGGLLGLGLGFSLMSLVEIVYYSTVKLYQNINVEDLQQKRKAQLVKGFYKEKLPSYSDIEVIMVKQYSKSIK